MYYFQFEIKDWIADTAHLSLEDEAAYLRLILFYYDTEAPIPHDDRDRVFRKCRISKEVGENILLDYFEMDALVDGWRHKKCDSIIAKFKDKSEQASRAGRASAQRKVNGRSTDVQRTFNEEATDVQPIHKYINPLIQESNIKTATKVATPEGVSSSVWEAFLKQRKMSKAVVTDTVVKRIESEAQKAGWSLEDALNEIVARGWRGFKAEWVQATKAPQRAFVDVAHMTVPASEGAFDALKKIEADREKAVPMPEHIRAQINATLRKV